MKKNEISSQWEIVIRFLFISLFAFGFLYPLTITGITKLFFLEKANGSLIRLDGKVVGSELLSQKLNSNSMFRYRPSAADYGKIPSGASNLSPSSLELQTMINERKLELDRLGIRHTVCSELLYSSGSGLDPHISVGCAREQAEFLHRVSKVPLDVINELIQQNIEYPIWGMMGRDRVNVTKLNLSWKQMTHE
ncbi:potassium-transporting ATPase subunit C [Leptospira bourretii]|uniref:Potassium-transporting ATPase subunit C n=1 Tax=Leptospira bourretii TaxID=2484962 RepID=A0A4R9ILK2_9LEPT|nr:potassium-transporting ATPase subunit C [Leptospira bourretii]TGK85088.1 potassium-transporting ATPase subunit C [Leptospira bourretii]TGK90853.1 potassium-transporting ATPase subunit C [Leptospira bourretii]TGL23410.1 potassium-transporting ATPase subunit C [Leptospira bourretii]TGL31244.1 potassium-transporting ATPase subunit C [Leptospira bourretii]